MSATLYVEGPDEQQLLRRIRDEHGTSATVVSVTRPRRGGVLGFFSREYFGITVRIEPDEPATPQRPTDPTLADLIDRADSADGACSDGSADPSDFAQALAALVTPAPAPHTVPPARPAGPPAGPAGPPAGPAGPPEPIAVADSPALSSRARLGVLADLRQLGVPVPMTAGTTGADRYAAIERVVAGLPAAPPAPRRAGEVLVLAGPLGRTRDLARTMAVQLHVPDEGVWIAGGTDADAQIISGPRNASRRIAAIKAADDPAIVVVATDVPDLLGDDRPSWPAQVIAALDPAAVWAVVDATRKTEDSRGELDRLGPIHALAVHSATHTSSPASVWDLDVPVALVDGRPATQGTWTALLLDALREHG